MNTITIPDDALKRFRDAASKFARHAAPRASRLLSLKGDIAALRDKGASFRTISELLTQNGIAASDTCVMRFCRRELGSQPIRYAKRKPSAAPKTAASANRGAASSAAMTKADHAALLDDLLSAVPANLSSQSADEGGPRIARIEFAKPEQL
jgi:hypothetical protein